MSGNYAYDAINSDLLAAPTTDSGDVPNSVWPMGLSHNRLGLKGAGFARQQNEAVLPAATAMAGVDMRLSPHAYREVRTNPFPPLGDNFDKVFSCTGTKLTNGHLS